MSGVLRTPSWDLARVNTLTGPSPRPVPRTLEQDRDGQDRHSGLIRSDTQVVLQRGGLGVQRPQGTHVVPSQSTRPTVFTLPLPPLTGGLGDWDRQGRVPTSTTCRTERTPLRGDIARTAEGEDEGSGPGGRETEGRWSGFVVEVYRPSTEGASLGSPGRSSVQSPILGRVTGTVDGCL